MIASHLRPWFHRITTFFCLLAACVASAQATAATQQDSTVINAIVNIHINKVRSWDDGYNTSSKGTGFVIDSERGLILTNKHILGVGPVVAWGEFANKKMIELVPVYRDPVHDFGLFSYRPEDLEGLDIEAIKLAAEARVGDKIRLYGNDGGHDLSIIEGVLSRIDRPAPNYGNTHTDFNTFYYQAALGSSGGSSGSPILNANNQAIALNAGAVRELETAFFLPMDIILPTVNKLLRGRTVSRGTLQTVFEFTPYTQFNTLGLSAGQTTDIRESSPQVSRGKLFVRHVIPEGPGDGALQTGDMLLSLDGHSIDDFLDLESALNGAVKRKLKLRLLRDGKRISKTLRVDDLFALTPDEYIDYGNGTVIPVGMSMARLFNIPVRGVTLAAPGPVFSSRAIGRLSLIEEIENQPIRDMDDFAAQVARVPVGSKFSVRFSDPRNTKYQQYQMLTDYSDWYETKRCRSRLNQAYWSCKVLNKRSNGSDKLQFSTEKPVTSMIVDVDVFRPVLVNRLNDVVKYGNGAVIDYDEGLVLTDRSIIDSSLSVVHITFNNGLRIPAKVAAIHPYLNLVLLRADLDGIEYVDGVLASLQANDIDSRRAYRLFGKSSMQDVVLDASATWPLTNNHRSVHDSMAFAPSPDFFGVYVNDADQIAAVNTRFAAKKIQYNDVIPNSLILSFVEAVRNGMPGMYQLEAGFSYISYNESLNLGMQSVAVENTDRVLSVANVEANGRSALLPGDIVLGVNGKSVASINSLYAELQDTGFDLDILRNGKPETIASTAELKTFEAFTDVVFYNGAVIHRIDEKYFLADGTVGDCLSIGIRFFGTPIQSANLTGNRCLVEIDGEKLDSVADIARLTRNKKGGDYTRLTTVELDNNFRIAEHQLREDPFYWPTQYWKLTEGDWVEQKR